MQAMNSVRRQPVGANSMSDTWAACISACEACADACTVWADECLSEPGIDRLLDSIRLDLACAEICRATAGVVTSFRDTRFAKAQLRACVAACRACALASGMHAQDHVRARACTLACEECERACEWLAC
jgi:hypothetical protein